MPARSGGRLRRGQDDARLAYLLKWVAVIVAVLTIPCHSRLNAQELHSKHFLFSPPEGAPAWSDLIFRDLYVISSNDSTKFADWVAYRLTAAEVVGTLDLERDWRSDPWLDADETLEAGSGSSDDYRGAHAAADYDRGHLAPLASFKGSPHASQVNYYSNIVPQKGPFNQGPWQRIEQAERDLVCGGQVLWVMTGTLYDGAAQPDLPNAGEKHTVPTGFWKIIARMDGGDPWAAAFIFEQSTPRDAEVTDHLVSINEVESRSGLDFFGRLSNSTENALEVGALTAAEWNGATDGPGCARAIGLP